ncbi:hypothetical protein [Rothia sp. ZJ932]|uniref:hypothetical protein n=1 Tax=Rothia sp. ZJ932 TaxID=2810516 RepID=UPI0019685C20|nr:hypothetical protein [Rothia sp. ZJ932]QRZ60810.1 hypothetical protein JR346_05815 [Rothia sp. ZJ932]
MSKLFGLALVPDENSCDTLIDFQNKLVPESFYGIKLGKESNLPHVSILQCPFFEEPLTVEKLSSLKEVLGKINQNDILGRADGLKYQPSYWAFMNFTFGDYIYEFQEEALVLLERFIDKSSIAKKDFTGYSFNQKKYYLKYGYRYLFDEFQPHVTVGRTYEEEIPSLVFEEFDCHLKNQIIKFDRLAFYEAGEHGSFKRALEIL